MKKSILLLFVFVLSLGVSKAQNWQPTNFTSVTYLPIPGIASHQNNLYATLFNGFGSLMYKMDPGNTSWSLMNTGSVSDPYIVGSAGTRLYVSTLNTSNYSSMLYYTTDGGNTFITDTAGLPHYQSALRPISVIKYYHGKVIIGVGGDTYYLKDTNATAFHSIDTPTLLVGGGADPVTFFNDTLYAWESSADHIMSFSSDWGTTWTQRSTNLPFDWNSHIFTADEVTGRLYTAGSYGSTQYDIRYSDDFGHTWTVATNAMSFVGLNASNAQQQVTTIYAHDPVFYMSLENNSNSTAPNILGSSTGFANLAYDTLGLPTNAAGTVNGTTFLMHNNKLALALNVIDVYLKDLTVGIKTTGAGENLALFPNPGSTLLRIKKAGKASKNVRVYDSMGRTIGTYEGDVQQIDVSEWQKGVYILEFIFEDAIVTRKFIRE